jgi:hypothetical protein
MPHLDAPTGEGVGESIGFNVEQRSHRLPFTLVYQLQCHLARKHSRPRAVAYAPDSASTRRVPSPSDGARERNEALRGPTSYVARFLCVFLACLGKSPRVG